MAKSSVHMNLAFSLPETDSKLTTNYKTECQVVIGLRRKISHGHSSHSHPGRTALCPGSQHLAHTSSLQNAKTERSAPSGKMLRARARSKALTPREEATVGPKAVSGQHPPSPAQPVTTLSICVLLVGSLCFSAGGGDVRRKSHPDSTEELSCGKPDRGPALPCTTPGHAPGSAFGLRSVGRGEPPQCAHRRLPCPRLATLSAWL